MRTKLFGVVSIYGVLIALAVLCAVILCQREGRRRGLPEDIGLDMALWAVPLGVVCARLYYVIFRWDYYAQNPVSILYFWRADWRYTAGSSAARWGCICCPGGGAYPA